MTEFTEAYDFHGRPLVDREGERIGAIETVFEGRDGTSWAIVHTGLLGTRRTAVPLAGAAPRGEAVAVAVDRDAIQGAPAIGTYESGLTEQAEAALRRHYGLGGDDAITRSEEELHVDTVWRARERLRLRKVIVTEHVTVPVRREELRLEREPIDADGDAPTIDPPAAAPDVEMTLYEERPVIEMRVVPRERVRLHVERVTEDHEIAQELRRERIGLDTHADGRERR